ncbi:hypothetical protein GR927_21730 [Mycolicibacterium sp. 3033]|nr:hypothetical protein [Mycolicibacterium aurantiacum]
MDPPWSCFLAEWYQPARPDIDGLVAALETVCARMRADGRGMRLIGAIAAAADEVTYGVFEADSATAVTLACRLAGRPVDRVVEGVQARLLPQ